MKWNSCEKLSKAPQYPADADLARNSAHFVLTQSTAAKKDIPLPAFSTARSSFDEYLRHAYRKEDDTLGYRCPAEPAGDFVRKGGALSEREGRQCVCNGLVSTIGLAQVRSDRTLDRPLLTAGNDITQVASYLQPGRDSCFAAEVVRHLLGQAGWNSPFSFCQFRLRAVEKTVERLRAIGEDGGMDDKVIFQKPVASVDDVQRGWHDLTLRVSQLEADKAALKHDNKTLRTLLERVIEHRQKSHGELVLLLTGLVSKLPINDVGIVVSRLVEHNTNVNEMLAALAKGTVDAALPQPTVLKALDQTKRDVLAALQPAIEELIQSDPPLESELLKSLLTDPESFFSPKMVRANRCFVKGHVPKARIIREFGEAALILFNDLTTDPKLNPRPKPDEIALGFKNDFEILLQQDPALLPDKRPALLALYQRIQRSKAVTMSARAQRIAFHKVSFLLELLHYYEHQNTETPEAIFAQRLPALVEQLVLTAGQETPDEKLILQAEALVAFVIHPDHRQMIVNNVGKAGGTGATLKHALRLRAGKLPQPDPVIAEFIKHIIPLRKPPAAASLIPLLRMLPAEMQRLVVKAIMDSERLGKAEAEALGKALAKELGLTGLEKEVKAPPAISPEAERQLAWDTIKELITRRAEPVAVAAAMRERLHAKYDNDEIRQSWITLTEADPMALIRAFCQLPYLADGKTDPIMLPVMQSYLSRLTHEKYAATYTKVLNSLKNMFKAKPDSPTLLNFLALVKWADAGTASKLSLDIGMPAH